MEDVFDSGKYTKRKKRSWTFKIEIAWTKKHSGPNEHEEEDAARDQDMEPGGIRHLRTRSLEQAVKIPVLKRESQRILLRDTSAIAQGEDAFGAAYVLYSVEEMTFKSAMESSHAAKWKEPDDSEINSLRKNK